MHINKSSHLEVNLSVRTLGPILSLKFGDYLDVRRFVNAGQGVPAGTLKKFRTLAEVLS